MWTPGWNVPSPTPRAIAKEAVGDGEVEDPIPVQIGGRDAYRDRIRREHEGRVEAEGLPRGLAADEGDRGEQESVERHRSGEPMAGQGG